MTSRELKMKLTLEKREKKSTFGRTESKSRSSSSTLASNTPIFSGKVGPSSVNTIKLDNELIESLSVTTVSEESSEEDDLPDNLPINIYLWDQAALCYPFNKEVKSKHLTILKLIYLLCNPEKWEGLIDQRDYIGKIMRDIYGFSLMHSQRYLFQLIDYMCECNCDPRDFKDNSIFHLVHLLHKHVTDTWDNSVLKMLKPTGKTLLSYHKEVGQFLNWLTLEISFEKGTFQHSACIKANPLIEDFMEAINNVLMTYGAAASTRKFLLHLSQQDRCFHEEVSTKTSNKLIFLIVASAREFITMWTSLDKNNLFSCDQPNFAFLIDDLVNGVMSQTITKSKAENLISESMHGLYEIIENGLDPASISKLLSQFIKKVDRSREKADGCWIASWTRFLKTILGHWLTLTEKWREATGGTPELSLTVNPIVLLFLQNYFCFFASKQFCEEELKMFGVCIGQITRKCCIGKLVDHYNFGVILQLIMENDWENIKETKHIFSKVEEMNELTTLDTLSNRAFKTERIG